MKVLAFTVVAILGLTLNANAELLAKGTKLELIGINVINGGSMPNFPKVNTQCKTSIRAVINSENITIGNNSSVNLEPTKDCEFNFTNLSFDFEQENNQIHLSTYVDHKELHNGTKSAENFMRSQGVQEEHILGAVVSTAGEGMGFFNALMTPCKLETRALSSGLFSKSSAQYLVCSNQNTTLTFEVK